MLENKTTSLFWKWTLLQNHDIMIQWWPTKMQQCHYFHLERSRETIKWACFERCKFFIFTQETAEKTNPTSDFFSLIGRKTIVVVSWLAVIFQRDFWPEAGQNTEWFGRSEFLRGRVFICVSWSPDEFQKIIILWRWGVVQVKIFWQLSSLCGFQKPQRYRNVSELYTKRRHISSVDSRIALDLVNDIILSPL